MANTPCFKLPSVSLFSNSPNKTELLKESHEISEGIR